jgi:hypothetical protein
MPIIARTYAFDFFNKFLAERWAKLSSSGDEKGRSSSSIITNALTNGSLNVNEMKHLSSNFLNNRNSTPLPQDLRQLSLGLLFMSSKLFEVLPKK